jgi:hypothetical protein
MINSKADKLLAIHSEEHIKTSPRGKILEAGTLSHHNACKYKLYRKSYGHKNRRIENHTTSVTLQHFLTHVQTSKFQGAAGTNIEGVLNPSNPSENSIQESDSNFDHNRMGPTKARQCRYTRSCCLQKQRQREICMDSE